MSSNPSKKNVEKEFPGIVALAEQNTRLDQAECDTRAVVINPFFPTVPTFAVRETAPLKPLRDDSALRTLSTLRGLRGAPEVPPLCRETQSLGQQMLNAPVGINGLSIYNQAYTYISLLYKHIYIYTLKQVHIYI